jgi:acyl carrier protein
MSNDEILERFAQLVQEVTGISASQVTPPKTFAFDLDVDSLSMVEIATAAEDTFGVHIPDEALKKINTVGDAVSFIAAAGVAA